MRFNPKASIDTGRIGHSGRGGGGAAGGGNRLPIPTSAGGLGLSGVLLVVLLVVAANFLGDGLPGLGEDSSGGAPEAGDSDRYAACQSGADANENADCARAAVENSLVAYWRATLPEQAGQQLRPAAVQTFSGQVSTGCGAAASQVGPFYCPTDETIYLDATFFPEVLEKQLGGQGGDFVEPYVLGHEYGHHIQNLLGYLGRVRTQLGAESVGDDRIQQRSGGRVDSDGWTHGSSDQRMRWFMTGYEQGSLQACDTFETDRL